MKTIFFTLAMFLLSTVAQANEDRTVIAQYAINISNANQDYDNDGVVWGVLKVKDNGSLTVDKYLYTWASGYEATFVGSSVIELAPAAKQKILWNIIALSDATIKTTYSQIVCMMMPMPGPSTALQVRSGYDYESKDFSGDLRVVESNTGCWAHSHTSLVNEYDRQTAASLEASLEILTLQLVK